MVGQDEDDSEKVASLKKEKIIKVEKVTVNKVVAKKGINRKVAMSDDGEDSYEYDVAIGPYRGPYTNKQIKIM